MWRRTSGRFLVVFVAVLSFSAVATLVGAIQATNVDPATVRFGGAVTGSLVPLPWPAESPTDTTVPWPAPDSIDRAGTRGYTVINARAGAPGTPPTPTTPGTPGTTTHQMQVERFGWPAPVLERVQLWWPWNDPNFTTATPNESGLRIIWPALIGMPLGTAAVIAWLAVAPLLLVELRRRRRGQCPRCGYDVRGAERCAECGAPIPPAVRARSRELAGQPAASDPATT